jgi:putative spermidine/putrescine transport system substrate-binding protein
MRNRKVAAAIASLALFVTACSGGASSSPAPSVPGSLGDKEGALNLVAWAGYVEEDWVAPFEAETGCVVNATLGNTSDEMVTLMKTGNYDGVSASGDASNRLIAGGDVAAVNLDLIPNYANVFEGLKSKPHNTVNGVSYGVPHGRGANLLMWRSDIVDPAPDSWSVVFDPNSPYKGKVTAYDSPIYIADAAVYLMATKPDLKITNPYELDQAQFDAAVALLKEQRTIIGKYWSLYTDEVRRSPPATARGRHDLAGHRERAREADGVPTEVVLPKEGATGWSDTWMVSSKARTRTACTPG